MNKILLDTNYGFAWQIRNGIYFKGYIYYNGKKLVIEQLEELLATIDSLKEFKTLLKSFNGSFSLIYEKDEMLFAAVDHNRTFPLFYYSGVDYIVITDNTFNNYFASFDKKAASQRQLLGMRYVVGKETVIEHLFQIKAGECLHYDGDLSTYFHHEFKVVEEDIYKDLAILPDSFYSILSNSVKRLISGVNNRTLVIPLSGGFDSRLIAALLYKEKYTNVICYTYGSADDEEVHISEKVATKLGYKWILIESDIIKVDTNYRKSAEFTDFVKFSYNNVSVIPLQDFFYVKHLKENSLIPADSIFLPGHSGDFLVGNHLYKADKRKYRKQKLIDELIKRHHVVNEYNFDADLEEKLSIYYNDVSLSYSLIDNYNYKERQAKLIVNSLRIYEYFGYEHRMLLWDLELSNFFKFMPFDLKLNSKFYIEEIFLQLFNDLGIPYIPASKRNSKKSIYRKIKSLLPFSIINRIRKSRSRGRDSFEGVPFKNMLHKMNEDLNTDISNRLALIPQWIIKKF